MIYTITLNPAIDRTLRCEEFKPHAVNETEMIGHFPAGKGVNVSRILAALEVPSMALGFVGREERVWFATFLKQEQIDSGFTPVAGHTRTNTTVIDDSGEEETHIKERGFTIGPDSIVEFTQDIGGRIGTGDIVCISGALPRGFEVDSLRSLVIFCTNHGAEVFLDVSGSLLKGLTDTKPRLIKPNYYELAQLTGRKGTDAMLEAAHEMGFPGILLSKGPDGLVFSAPQIKHTQASPPIEAVNTVGAGDAALAGFIAARYEGLDLEGKLAWAAAAGAANAREQFAGIIDRAWFEKTVKERW
ncbi:1-phosphofructokinase family hexose kinase [Planctomycetota bacterium]